MCSGVINIYKEKGFTSHDIVAIVRKKLGRVKAGHTGTLDPDAEGVLPVCVGKATKISEYIASDIKEYKTVMTLGVSTTTGDSSGDIIEKHKVTVSQEQIADAVMAFKGIINQIPPMYSAIKVNGKKLYELARNGIEIERKAREITIYDIKVDEIREDNVYMTVLCSKGTYIRSLCSDIGDKLNCGGHMSYLLRTRAGKFYLKDSVTLNQLERLIETDSEKKFIMPIDNVLSEYKKVVVREEANKYLYNGNKISFRYLVDFDRSCNEEILIYDSGFKLIGIYKTEREKEVISPLTMLLC